MASEKSVSVSVGPGAVGLLGVAFVVLKLCGVITWPWVWVLLPFWGGLAVLAVFLAVVLVIFAFAAFASARR